MVWNRARELEIRKGLKQNTELERQRERDPETFELVTHAAGTVWLFRSAGRCSVGRDVKEEYNPITLVINMNLRFTAEPAGRDVDLPIIV